MRLAEEELKAMKAGKNRWDRSNNAIITNS